MDVRPAPALARLGLSRRTRGWFCLGVLVAVIVAACAGPSGTSTDGPSNPAPDTIRVVATTTVFADIVRAVGGDRVDVASIVPAGVGPEDYEPRPDDARRLAGADLFVSNGVGLDDWLGPLIEAAGEGSVGRLVLGDGIPTIDVEGRPNPHFWLDPTLVRDQFLPAIVGRLSSLDPDGATAYAANADAYAAELTRLDEANAAAVAPIPEEDRKLVTTHDAFPYFARHYGFDVVGVILPNPGQEPTAAQLADLVATVRAAGVRAIFAEAQSSPKLARTLAEEAGVDRVVTTLYNDALGPAPADTYLGMMAWNMDRIVEALT